MRNVFVDVPKGQRQMVAAIMCAVFAQATEAEARRQWRAGADRVRERFPTIGALMGEAEADVLAHITFPAAHRLQIHSTSPLERLNAEIKRRTDVVGIFPTRPQSCA
jgi:putative transposase